jgi:CheY-like chemotaxis protein
MSRILLIDDEANQGWKEILQRIFFRGQNIDAATTKEEAVIHLAQNSYDLIFLDLRYREHDHHSGNLKNFQGYEILTQEIRGGFENLNFATPIIIFTASNKIWNIHGMLDAGADSYYIKEHPDQATDLEFSRQNFIRLSQHIPELLALGEKRTKVLQQVNVLIALISTEILNVNIRNRILEKLKIGYTTLFHKHTTFEDEKFTFSNEMLAFICFWSILEEIAKDFFKDQWIKAGSKEGQMNQGNWILRNGNPFIQCKTELYRGVRTDVLKIELSYKGDHYTKKSRRIYSGQKDFNFYSGRIGLSLQIYAIMIIGKGWSSTDAKHRFYDLNEFRNKVDFIHSSVGSIFSKKLTDENDKSQAYQNCIKMLDFLTLLLRSSWI